MLLIFFSIHQTVHWEKILKLSAWNVTETSWEGLRGRLRGNDQKCGVYRCHLMLGGSNALKTQPSLTTLQIYFSAISPRKVRFEESPLAYQRRSSALCRAKSTGSYNGTSSERSKNSSCAENGPEMHEKIIFSVKLENFLNHVRFSGALLTIFFNFLSNLIYSTGGFS